MLEMGLHVLGKEATNSRVVEMNERVEKLNGKRKEGELRSVSLKPPCHSVVSIIHQQFA